MRLVSEEDRFIVHNADGAWSVSKQHGHIVRFRERGAGRLVVDDSHADNPDPRAPRPPNDPRFGGLGAFHAHVAREVDPPPGKEEHRDYFRTCDTGTGLRQERHRTGVRAVTIGEVAETPEAIRVAVSTVLADEHADVFSVHYRYLFQDSRVSASIRVVSLHQPGIGPPAFVKEPKIAVSLCPAAPDAVAYRRAETFDAQDTRLREIELAQMPDPGVKTAQLSNPDRWRVRFSDDAGEARPFNVVVTDWSSWDAWAERSNGRARMERECARYCLQGLPLRTDGPGGTTLTRKWEIAKRREEPNIALMLHSWEGGTGAQDCLCAARAFGAPGEAFTMQLVFSYGDGWRE